MRILVTRPEPGATRTAAFLKERGHEPVMLPLSKIVPISHKIPDGPFDAVAITSSNALEYASEDLLAILSGLEGHVVGERTANAARKAGLTVRGVAKNAHDLARLMADQLAPQSRLLYMSGRVRMPTFEDDIRAANMEITTVETYDTKEISYTTDLVKSIIGEDPIDGVLVYSVVAAKAVRDLLGETEHLDLLDESKIYCLSPRIAELFEGRKKGEVIAAPEPDELLLVSLLEAKG